MTTAMRKIDKRIGSDVKLARALVARAVTLTLPYEARCKSRLAAHLDDGEAVALLMPRGTVLAEGDVLVADDGALIRVVAAPESLMRVTASSAAELMRAAYHLGNRHTPVELGDGYLQLEVDTVLRDMLQGIGMRVEVVDAPFHPEAYRDEFQERLNELIEAKLKGKTVAVAPKPGKAPVIDMMEALKRSLAAHGASPQKAPAGQKERSRRKAG